MKLRRLWQAHRVLAVTLSRESAETGAPQFMCVGEPAQWSQLPSRNATDDQVAGRRVIC